MQKSVFFFKFKSKCKYKFSYNVMLQSEFHCISPEKSFYFVILIRKSKRMRRRMKLKFKITTHSMKALKILLNICLSLLNKRNNFIFIDHTNLIIQTILLFSILTVSWRIQHGVLLQNEQSCRRRRVYCRNLSICDIF